MAADTPTAAVINATRPDQAVRWGLLQDLGTEVVPSPAVLIVGEVARQPVRPEVSDERAPTQAPLQELLRLAM
jgi:siroheme synthase